MFDMFYKEYYYYLLLRLLFNFLELLYVVKDGIEYLSYCIKNRVFNMVI